VSSVIPGVRLRLTATEALIITRGLFLIQQRHQIFAYTGKTPCCFPYHMFQERHLAVPAGCPFGISFLLSAARKMLSNKNGGRLSLTGFELAAVLLGVRVTIKYVRHGHVQPTWNHQCDSGKRLIRKLERYRKRAKRLFIRRYGRDAYATAAQEWNQTVRWVRVHYLGCRCVRQRGFLRKVLRMLVDDGVAVAKVGLAIRQKPVPGAKEMRRLVRLAFAETRRGRHHFGVMEVLNQEFGKTYLADFIIERRWRADHSEQIARKKHEGESEDATHSR